MSDSIKELRNLLNQNAGLELGLDQVERILQFYGIVLRENQVQNLTRLTSPEEFYYGHIEDALFLRESQLLSYPALDLGSGVGVPGILMAILEEGSWILAESEGKKAEYLQSAVNELGLEASVGVVSGRAEEYLKKNRAESVVARAVGPVSRIFTWIGSCSTWNTLVLFKGPGWGEEWSAFQKTRFRNKLRVESEFGYQTGSVEDRKARKLIRLARV